MFLGKSVLKICSKFTGEHPCRSGCSPVNLLHIFRTPSYKNTSGVAASATRIGEFPRSRMYSSPQLHQPIIFAKIFQIKLSHVSLMLQLVVIYSKINKNFDKAILQHRIARISQCGSIIITMRRKISKQYLKSTLVNTHGVDTQQTYSLFNHTSCFSYLNEKITYILIPSFSLFHPLVTQLQ